VPAVARHLALAHHWRGLIRDGVVRDQTDLSRIVGVSRARISQVMRLLDLAPDIQEAVLDGKVDGPGAELALRAVAGEPLWAIQRRT
jgi:ParB-like chromosome segregation protein Spo0J